MHVFMCMCFSPRHCQESLDFKVGDEVSDLDGKRGRIRTIDPEDAENPYEIVYSTAEAYWTAVSTLSKPSVVMPCVQRVEFRLRRAL